MMRRGLVSLSINAYFKSMFDVHSQKLPIWFNAGGAFQSVPGVGHSLNQSY